MAEEIPVTDTFLRWRSGDASALDDLLPRVYDELRALADAYMRRERAGHTLQPTALVHEAFLRLLRLPPGSVQNRVHFFALAAQAMRRILADHARRHRAAKRGGNAVRVPLELIEGGAGPAMAPAPGAGGFASASEVAADDLDTALEDLAKLDQRQARVVELRFFGGLSIEETAEVLGVSSATVKRDWLVARAWLHRELRGGTSG
jgi:RNA polymerase sigma factor (TIGR02999 family)